MEKIKAPISRQARIATMIFPFSAGWENHLVAIPSGAN
jgi:hypothetical protein